MPSHYRAVVYPSPDLVDSIAPCCNAIRNAKHELMARAAFLPGQVSFFFFLFFLVWRFFQNVTIILLGFVVCLCFNFKIL